MGEEKNELNELNEFSRFLFLERLFEDHEMLVDNLMGWNNDQKNQVLFLQRSDKVALFNCPEKFLNSPQMASGNDYDEHSR